MDAVTVTTDDARVLGKLVSCGPLVKSFDRVIVVDNLSADGSAQMATSAGAVVVSRDERGGYGSCVNLGVRHTRGPSFAVLNPDITFDTPEVVERLSAHLEKPGIGLVAPGLVLPDGRRQDSARHIPTPLDLLRRRLGASELGSIWKEGPVPWVVGACFIARRDAWEQVGGFDERYFLYFDDVDLCWRLRQAGWLTYVDPSVTVRHEFGAASRKPVWAWRTRQHALSAARFYVRNPRFIFSRSLPGDPVHARAVEPA